MPAKGGSSKTRAAAASVKRNIRIARGSAPAQPPAAAEPRLLRSLGSAPAAAAPGAVRVRSLGSKPPAAGTASAAARPLRSERPAAAGGSAQAGSLEKVPVEARGSSAGDRPRRPPVQAAPAGPSRGHSLATEPASALVSDAVLKKRALLSRLLPFGGQILLEEPLLGPAEPEVRKLKKPEQTQLSRWVTARTYCCPGLPYDTAPTVLSAFG